MIFFFNDTATTEIYTLSLHDALPICSTDSIPRRVAPSESRAPQRTSDSIAFLFTRWQSTRSRSEEHTSETQSRQYLVCRLLLDKKKNPSPPESVVASYRTARTPVVAL